MMIHKKFGFLLVTGLFVSALHAQQPWPAETPVNKPWTRWWWLGSEVNKKDLSTVMAQYRQAGLGGLEITPIYGVQGEEAQYVPFLSAQWMDLFEHTLQEGRRLQLGIDLANATGWPFGGPWVTEADASKYMTFKTYSLKEGEQLNEKIALMQQPLVYTANGKQVSIDTLKYPVTANSNLQALALDQVRYKQPLPLVVLKACNETGNSIDLTKQVSADGKLNWTAPKGNWTLYAIFQGFHGKQVERAAPGGEGDVIDHFSADALKHYLDVFDKAFAGRSLDGLRGFFNDSYEVDDAKGQANFTPTLFEEFKKRRGYDLTDQLPALFQQDTPEKNSRVLCDYRSTIDELLLEHFTINWHRWAASKNKLVRNQSHGSPANILDLYSVVDIPETEGNATEVLRMKFATSAAHVTGKPLASAEAATWLNEHFISTLADVKKALDVYFIAGVNHLVYHGTAYSPPSEPWPGRLFYASVEFTQANPFWKHFPALNKYVTRCQSFLQQAKPDNDVLLYFPIYDKFMEPGRAMLEHFDRLKPEFTNTGFEACGQTMQAKGYGFDYISDRQLQQAKAGDARIQTAGAAYRSIVLPGCKYLPLQTLQKLVELAKAGATIIVYKKMPESVPGYAALNQQQAWQQLVQQLHFETAGNNIRKAVIGKGAFVLGDDLDELLQYAGIYRETLVDQGLQFTRKKYRQGELYFITNTSGKPFSGFVPLQADAQQVSLYNPMTGDYGMAQCIHVKEQTSVLLDMATDESYILITNQQPGSNAKPYPYSKPASTPVEINGNWQLRFTDGGPALPAPVQLTTLQPWTSLGSDAANIFSGTGVYSIHFAQPAQQAKAYRLNLGRVAESAQVTLNGKKIAILIGPDFSVTIPAQDLKQDNLLEIEVVNSMANRIIDLDKRQVHWKKFNNTNFPARLAENRGANGLFTAANWQPRVSGLEGPVTITPLTTEH